MKDGQANSPQNPTFPTLLRIDIVCDQFESQWREGKQPDIATHLSELAERDRPALVVELVRLDVDYRRRAGETPNVADCNRSQVGQ
jgi:hypothetical protein